MKKSTLQTLADQINSEHRQCQKAAEFALACALEVGRLLAEAKSQVKHGEWLPWIEKNCEFGRRQAQGYKRLHDNRERIAEMRTTGALFEGMHSALELLREERCVVDEIQTEAEPEIELEDDPEAELEDDPEAELEDDPETELEDDPEDEPKTHYVVAAVQPEAEPETVIAHIRVANVVVWLDDLVGGIRSLHDELEDAEWRIVFQEAKRLNGLRRPSRN
jgi:hypothetical protein